LEDSFTVRPNKLRHAAEKVDFQLSQQRLVVNTVPFLDEYSVDNLVGRTFVPSTDKAA
jgi:hypothetical protein